MILIKKSEYRPWFGTVAVPMRSYVLYARFCFWIRGALKGTSIVLVQEERTVQVHALSLWWNYREMLLTEAFYMAYKSFTWGWFRLWMLNVLLMCLVSTWSCHSAPNVTFKAKPPTHQAQTSPWYGKQVLRYKPFSAYLHYLCWISGLAALLSPGTCARAHPWLFTGSIHLGQGQRWPVAKSRVVRWPLHGLQPDTMAIGKHRKPAPCMRVQQTRFLHISHG